jgi:putative phage-type endonuclease
MNAREDFLSARRSGLGGSDIAAILGLSPFKSAVDVFLDKTGQTPDDNMNEAMFWGTVLEDVVAKHYQDTSGCKVQRLNSLIRHPVKTFAIANIDRAVVTAGSRARFDDGKLLGADGIVECKTASAYKAGEWGRPDDDDAIPTHYAAQGMWYLGITGLDWCDVPVLIGGQKYLVKRIERDDETIRGMMDRAEEFWFKHVIERVAPEPKNGDDAIKLFPHDSGRTIEANPKTLELLSRAVELKQQIAALELELDGDRKKGINGVLGELKAYMADASAISIGSETLATWKAQTSQRLDTTAFKAAHPELYAQFVKPSESRVFRIK